MRRRLLRPLPLLVAAIGALHVAGLALLGLAATAPVALGVTAYTLGMRHAFDADHVAAIDNTTRKLVADGRRPLTVGFWFSLGHATVVLALTVLIAVGLRGLDGTAVHRVAGTIGPAVSGTFLVAIGAINLMSLLRRDAGGAPPGGPVGRLLGPVLRAVRHPWQMYAVGLLFGLGFDTATEIALLATAGAAASSGLPLTAVLALPLLFAAGMTLLDTLDGAVMRHVYATESTNSAITGLSVLAALGIGGLELLQVLSEHAPQPDLRAAGYAIAALLIGTWLLAIRPRRSTRMTAS